MTHYTTCIARFVAGPRPLALALITSLLFTAGCLQPREAEYESPKTQAKYPQIVIINNFLPWVAFHDPIVTPAEGEVPMKVTVPIRLKQWQRKEAQYRFIFLDQDGRPVGPEMDWRWEVLNPRTLVYLEASALDTAAVDWRLEIRKNLKKN